ncbi:hypothetical protein Q9251_02995 [Alkalihalobacillus macyae]|nr:hypothetical protein [Alkalihalobacillus macyae]MDP4549842.1 hypothetical protein [Alkalihalobacillus macyae]
MLISRYYREEYQDKKKEIKKQVKKTEGSKRKKPTKEASDK